MDLSTFYALFSATCFTLLGLWWNVVQHHPEWLADLVTRRDVGGVYLSFLLPALMGLFAQVGGATNPGIWRVSFVIVALVGCWSSVRLLRGTRRAGRTAGPAWKQWTALVLYAVIAVIGAAPEVATQLSLTPLQAEATLLILLVVVAHGLVWQFMTTGPSRPADAPGGPARD